MAAAVDVVAPLVSDEELAAIEDGRPASPDLIRRMAADLRRARADLFAMVVFGTRTLARLDDILQTKRGPWPPGCPVPADWDPGH